MLLRSLDVVDEGGQFAAGLTERHSASHAVYCTRFCALRPRSQPGSDSVRSGGARGTRTPDPLHAIYKFHEWLQTRRMQTRLPRINDGCDHADPRGSHETSKAVG